MVVSSRKSKPDNKIEMQQNNLAAEQRIMQPVVKYGASEHLRALRSFLWAYDHSAPARPQRIVVPFLD